MNFYELIKRGNVIRIEDNRRRNDFHYDPAEFWMQLGKVFAWCPEVGTFAHTASEDELNKHFEQMIEEGLDIIIQHTNKFTNKKGA